MKLFEDKLKSKKRAFTLIEVMLLLVVLSLVFASSTSVITRKHKLKPRRSVHGTYICYRNWQDGALHEIMYSGKSLLFDRNNITECRFEAPKAASYLYVQLIGGGGAGGNANYSLSTSSSSSTVYGDTNYVDFMRNITSTGLTKDYIHSFKRSASASEGDDDENDDNYLRFSLKAFNKILRDYDVKMFVYDYAGSGATGGELEQNYMTRTDTELSEEESAASATNPDVFQWYKSLCAYSGSSTVTVAPDACVKRFFNWNTRFTYDDANYLQYNALDADPYCQLRYPIFKNCPWVRDKFRPQVNTVKCSGGSGGSGGLIASPVVDFGLGYSYALGQRTGYKDGVPDPEKTIDWSMLGSTNYGDITLKGIGAPCVVGYNIKTDYASGKPGVLLTFDEACPDGVNCKDVDGNEIKNPIKTTEGYVASASEYRKGLQSVKECEKDENGVDIQDTCQYVNKNILGYFPITDYYGYSHSALFFKVFPSVDYTISPHANEGCVPMDTANMWKAGDGKDGGLPYFTNAAGNIVERGIRLCHNGACNTYSNTNETLTGAGSFVAGKGGKGAPMIPNMVTARYLRNPNVTCKDIDELQGQSGTRTITIPTSVGKYSACSGPVGFVHNGKCPYNDNCKYMFAYPTSNYDYSKGSAYNCPRTLYPTTDGNASSVGFYIELYYNTMKLWGGERGRAGGYKSLFARSFGDSALRMRPGRGGQARPISPGSSNPGDNGEATSLGTDCDENGENCAVTVSVRGGLGGRAKFTQYSESYNPTFLTNKQIWEYAHNPQKAPEPVYSQNYTNKSYLGEDSEFQNVSFLSDLSMIEDGQVVALLGRGGDAGYVKHNCFLRPFYFRYRYPYSYSSYSSYWYIYTTTATIPNLDGDDYTPAGVELDEWEGYTNFSDAIIRQLDVCKANGKQPQYQYEETQAQSGYPGAIVIIW